jgi:hypothetical protein
VNAAHEEAEVDEGEHGAEGVAAVLDAAWIRHFEEGTAEAFRVIHLERAAFSTGADVRFFIFFGKLRGAPEEVGLGVQRIAPEFFGASVRLVIMVGGVGIAELGKAFGVSGKMPVGDFVNGSGMALGIAETLRQQGFVTVAVGPLRGDGSQGEAKGLGGEIGPPGFVQPEEAEELVPEPRAGVRNWAGQNAAPS